MCTSLVKSLQANGVLPVGMRREERTIQLPLIFLTAFNINPCN